MIYNKIIIDPTKISEDLLIRLADELTDSRSLSVLGLNCSPIVQMHVVCNKNTPIPLFEVLYKKSSWEVRSAIAEQERTPKRILEKLSNDSHINVRFKARHTLKKLEH